MRAFTIKHSDIGRCPDGRMDVPHYREDGSCMHVTLNLHELCLRFLDRDDDAMAWGDEPDEFADAADCDVMAERFVKLATMYGFDARVVECTVSAVHESIVDRHWFAVVDGIGVDWTARQFHNVKGQPLDYSQIPSPLLFLWPGHYPMPTLILEEEPPS